MSVLLIKTAIALSMSAAMLAAWSPSRHSRFQAWLARPEVVLGAAILLRIIPYIVVYLVYGYQAQADVSGAFFPWAVAAADGQVVYHDFQNDYGPLFPYVLGFSVRLWQDPRAVILTMLAVDLGTLIATYWLFAKEMILPQRTFASLLYLLSPATFILILLGGQEDVWLWGATVFVIALILRAKPFMAGMAAALGLLLTKAFLLLYILPLLLITPRQTRYLGGLAALGLIALLPMWLIIGPDLWMPLRQASNWSPPNIWFLLNAATGGIVAVNTPGLTYISLLLVALGNCLFMWQHRAAFSNSAGAYAAAWTFVFCLFMLLSPKSFGNYAGIFLLPLTFLIVQKRDKLGFGLMVLLNILVSIQPSLWFRIGSPMHLNYSYLNDGAELLELGLELAMVVILLLLLQRSWVWISRESSNSIREFIPVRSAQF